MNTVTGFAKRISGGDSDDLDEPQYELVNTFNGVSFTIKNLILYLVPNNYKISK